MLLVQHVKHRLVHYELLIVPDKEGYHSIKGQGKASGFPQEICHAHNGVLSLESELMLRQDHPKEALLGIVIDFLEVDCAEEVVIVGC